MTYGLEQWFLTWVRSNPRRSVNQSQRFGGGPDTHMTHLIHDDTPPSLAITEGFDEFTYETGGVQHLQQG